MISISPSRINSRIAMKLTVTPARPSSGVNRRPTPETALFERRQDVAHASRTDSGSRARGDGRTSPRALRLLECQQHLLQRHLRQGARQRPSRSSALACQTSRSSRGMASISAAARLKRSYSCSRRTSSARGSSSPLSPSPGARQQHARFDLGQRCGHHQVLAGQLQLQILHQLDVLDVLALISAIGMLRYLRSAAGLGRAADRAGLRTPRGISPVPAADIQIARQLRHALAVDYGEWHLDLLGRQLQRRCSRRRLRQRSEIRLHHRQPL